MTTVHTVFLFGLVTNLFIRAPTPRFFDENGHAIQDGSLEALVGSLQAVGLPATRPAFPNMLCCPAAGLWARQTLGRMTRLLHQVVGRALDPQWATVLL